MSHGHAYKQVPGQQDSAAYMHSASLHVTSRAIVVAHMHMKGAHEHAKVLTHLHVHVLSPA